MTIEEQVQKTKEEITKNIKQTMKVKGYSLRKLSEKVGMKHSQIARMLREGENYTIDNLLKVLIALDLAIETNEKETKRGENHEIELHV